MELLTVFTPAYNRAHTLPRTYGSLQRQSCKDFIWMIVDDGSTDGTQTLIKSWMDEEKDFKIEYIYKENGGMHTAHNVAYEHIQTELNICIDSDDAMPFDAVEKIKNTWNRVREQGYAGIIGLDADMNTGKIIGKGFPKEMKETTLCGYYAQGGCGDKKLVYRTDVIRSVPEYPVFDGEKYVALAYKYRLIDQKYKLLTLDEVLCEVEYQRDGSSMNMFKQYRMNPKGFAFWRKVCMLYPESKKRLFVDCIHYTANSIIAKDKHYICRSPRKTLTLLVLPIGTLLAGLICYKTRNS